ncbi:DNA-3-methyladenine glycosylase 2 family protein [Paenibacillus sp. N4]|uniref:DNA-3-methyladenine glycosylase family protein n=1 Tax=Paenibacillus vietnamensis TaxID=2590547 RepID=UPI001CD11D74|nr:DNA-3-methyladenine glycosylase 2 family protein [Paenibacillus vietnamensis]MCA0755899.1 DNA-3-methyladenine glycosylase 2 family protein [Paenibacillus vietnamensis]
MMTKTFDYGEEEIEYLKKRDAALGAAIDRIGKVERAVTPDLFSALTHAIVGQLISVKAAATIWGRLQSRFGEFSAERLAAQTAADLKQCGLSMKKAECIKEIAELIAQGGLQMEELRRLSDKEVIDRLTAIKGVGIWTAEMLLLHCLERRDVVSWGDIAIRRGMMRLYGLDTLSKQQFNAYRDNYSPYGTVASIYLWELSAP